MRFSAGPLWLKGQIGISECGLELKEERDSPTLSRGLLAPSFSGSCLPTHLLPFSLCFLNTGVSVFPFANPWAWEEDGEKEKGGVLAP